MDFLVFISEQWLLVSLLLVLIFIYIWREKAKGGKSVSVHEATRLMNNDSAVLVDVREGAEFKSGHIANAINIPHNRLAEKTGELEPLKQKLIILADKMGQHVGNVGRTLKQQGYNVCRLDGGMAEWQNQSLPLVKKNTKK